MSTHQGIAVEYTLMTVGTVACALFWWHNGETILPYYILFSFAVVAGLMGSLFRAIRRLPPPSAWGAGIAIGVAGTGLGASMGTLQADPMGALVVIAGYTAINLSAEIGRGYAV